MYKAKVTFAGQISMIEGEVRELDSSIAAPLVECGYLEAVNKNENKRNNKRNNLQSHSRDRG